EWLCGKPPFSGNMWEIWHQHMHTAPPPLRPMRPDLPPKIEEVVRRALAKNPQDRFVSIQAFARALVRANHTSIPFDEDATQATVPLRAIPNVSTSIPLPHTAPFPSQSNQSVQVLSSVQTLTLPKPLPASALQNQNRERLLRRVRSFWITGVLEQSLHGAALLALGLQEQPDAVTNPWHLIVQHPQCVPQPLPAGTRVVQVYDASDGELLILGAPGSGKTTLLLELARDLLQRAERDEHHPMPVVFNLSTWSLKQQRLTTWLVDELNGKYLVPRKLGQALV